MSNQVNQGRPAPQASPGDDVIVRVQGVKKTYQQGAVSVPALRGLDLTLRRGEFTVLAGSSGSGKSTLLNLIGSLDEATEGGVEVEGRPLGEMSGAELAELRLRRIGFVFQAYNLIPVLSAAENAEYVLLLQGVPAAERRARIGELLEAVGLAGMERRRPAELSGGQQQRVAVARAIVTEPAVVLADEPTANLDSQTKAELISLMSRLNEEQGITFLFSTHDDAIVRAARRVVRLKDGRISSDEQR